MRIRRPRSPRQLDHLSSEAHRPTLRLVPAPPNGSEPTWCTGERPIELKLTFSELTLIHKSLQAVKTLGALSQDELLNDTIHVVDLALNEAV
jgi:hypothetical protein